MFDKKDEVLLNVLREDSSLSTYKISKKTSIPQTTVLHRIRKLRESGIIRRYTIDVDDKKLGKGLKALIFVKVSNPIEKTKHGVVGSVEAKLTKHPLVRTVKRLSGKFDFVVEIVAENVEELDKFLIERIRSLDEVADTETVLVLQEWRT